MSDPCPRCDETSGFNGSFCTACGYDIELEAADHRGEGADLGEFDYDDFVQAMGGEPRPTPWGWILALVLIGVGLVAWRFRASPQVIPGLLLAALIGFAVFAWAARRAGRRRGEGGGGGRSRGGYLCDRCKYDDARYCSRPERPNATSCPDFKAR